MSNFYPRSPCGERPPFVGRNYVKNDFYPRSPCGERQKAMSVFKWDLPISIHALLAESDGDGFAVVDVLPISIHALLAESDAILLLLYFMTSLFLSTLSLRRATHRQYSFDPHFVDFYPRSPCGERLQRDEQPRQQAERFLSTLSLRRATLTKPWKLQCKTYFYPRSPCGERPGERSTKSSFRGFLSTLSLRRATGHALLL